MTFKKELSLRGAPKHFSQTFSQLVKQSAHESSSSAEVDPRLERSGLDWGSIV